MIYIGLHSLTAKTVKKLPAPGQTNVEIRVSGFNKVFFMASRRRRGLGSSALFLSNFYCAPGEGYLPQAAPRS